MASADGNAAGEPASGAAVPGSADQFRLPTVFLVGAGPGDRGLLTVRAHELLASCDALVHDALANPALIDVAVEAARSEGRRVALFEVGKRGGDSASARQEDIDALLVRLGREKRCVVRLKGGDPFVFGRGGEEAIALARAGVPFEVVPGVTAGIAAPAYAGIPVTHRAVATSVTLVTGSEDRGKEATQVDWDALARAGGTLVLYMGVTWLPRIVERLIAGGRSPDTPAAAIQWGTYPRQRTVVATLGTLVDAMAAGHLAPPVITVIGPVVALREQIAWFDRRPLHGRRVLVTRARAQAGALADRLAAAGAEVVELPATRIEPLDPAPVREALLRLRDYQWVVFTSQNAVQIAWDTLRAMGRDARAFAGTRIAAVGPATSDTLLACGLAVDVVPARYVAEGVLEAMGAPPIRDALRGARVLYLAADDARPVLPAGLESLGARVDRVPLYRSVPDGTGAEAVRAQIEQGRIDVATFASGSAARAFVEAVGAEAARRVPAVSMGPITTTTAREAGLTVVAEADPSTLDGLVAAVIRALSTEA